MYMRNRTPLPAMPERNFQMTAKERREEVWRLIRLGLGSQDDQARATGFTVSRVCDYRRLWKFVMREHPAIADSVTCEEALSLAKKHGVKTKR